MSSRSESLQSGLPPGARRTLKWSLGVLAALIVLVAVAVGLFQVAAHMVPRYHDKIQQEVSAELGLPVRMGKVSLHWHGWGPAISFRDVRVLNAETNQAVLSAQNVALDFTLFALLHGTRALPSGIRVDAPQVAAKMTADGKIVIPGLVFTAPASANNMAGMLGAHLKITDGRLALTLAGPDHPVWVFAPVNLEVGGGRSHTVELVLGMPKALGAGKLRLEGKVDTPKAALASWRWNAAYSLDRLLLAPLDRFVPAGYPSVRGILASSGNFSGSGFDVEGADGQLDATDLAAGSSRLARLQTRFELVAKNGYTLTLTDTRLVEPDKTWKPGRLSVGRDAAGRMHASIDNLALAALPPLAGFLPEKLSSLGNRLHEMRPSGNVNQVHFALTPGKSDLDLQAKLNDVGVYAAAGAPGFDHLSGAVAVRDGTGTFRLDAPGFTLRMPHIFAHPVPLDRVVGNIAISLSETGFKVATDKLALTGPSDLAGVLRGEINMPFSGPITMELAAKAGPVAVVPARKLYLPTGLMPKALDDWLLQDLDGGKIDGATITVTGRADRFPFTHGGGRFAVDFGFDDVTLKPGEHWEPLRNLSGSVHFLNAGMSADITGGQIGRGAKVVKATVALADLFKPQLKVQAEVAGDASDFLAFLLASPVGGDLRRLDSLHTSGPVSARVNLDLPIMQIADFKLAGTLQLAGVNAQYENYALTKLAGTVSFDSKGPTEGRLNGELFATPITLGLSRGTDARSMRVTLAGRFPVATLSKVADYDFSRYAHGTLPLDAAVTVPLASDGPPLTVSASSELDGLALELPAPVGKPASGRTSFTAHATLVGDGLQVTARYADVLSACAELALNTGSAKLRGADVVLGPGACHAPVAGIYVRGGWPSLALKPWFARLPQQGGVSASSWTMPEALGIDLHFGEISAFGERFSNQTIKGRLDSSQITLDFAGDMLAGQVLIPRKPTNANPIVATLTRGRFTMPGKHAVAVSPASAAGPAPAGSAPLPAPAHTAAAPAATGSAVAKPDAGSASGFKPQDIPPFTLRAAHLELGTAPLDDVNIVARSVPGGIAVDPIHVGGGALKLEGSFVWLNPPDGNPQGALHFVGDVKELGKLLTGLGLGPVITGHGALSAGLAWHALPGDSFAKDLLGRVSVDLRDGSISQVNPGAGRLLSLLNLANIPRYLVFNFHNLFGKGFPFSRIHGDYVIDSGIAHTKGLDINSSVASIKLTGQVNIAQGTMDQKAEISPNYFGSLPVVAALFGGLGVGAVVYAVTKLFGSPLAALTKLQYTITGPIRDPLVKPLGKTPPLKAGKRIVPVPAGVTHPVPAPAPASGG